MRIRLTGATRWRAASILALLYMLCVFGPPAALVLADAARASNCLTEHNHSLRSVHVHEHSVAVQDGGTTRVHSDGTSHKPSKAPDDRSSDQCCGLACLSALPAGIVQIDTPAVPVVVVALGQQMDLAGKGPERLYRPPISVLSL
jgi:hypothetical protein